jgi:hypothetical protein
MPFSDYSERRSGDPEVMVELITDTGHTATGFVDAPPSATGSGRPGSTTPTRPTTAP